MSAPPVRLTIQVKIVLSFLLAEPGAEWYGLEILDGVELGSGTTYPILKRLEAAGWVCSRWEERGPDTGGRPLRHYFRIDPSKTDMIRDALRAAEGRLYRRVTAPAVSV